MPCGCAFLRLYRHRPKYCAKNMRWGRKYNNATNECSKIARLHVLLYTAKLVVMSKAARTL
eukprot:scaffold1413_cov117-Cylindrotheca_fusiformis.AAC.9